jgi:ATP phosphoribosyltransferase regulatory subunit
LFLASEYTEAVLARLAAAGYARVEPPVLQPAAIFFDSGEDLRGQLYLTADESGADYCLRPEYTIPVSRHYLASPEAGGQAAFSYLGPVFRFRAGDSSEFTQAGIESFGRLDREAADAETLTLALDAARLAPGPGLEIRIGDTALFSGLLEALDLAPQWRRRITRGHIQGKSLQSILHAPLNDQARDHSGVLALLDGADKKGARALVEDLLSIAGIAAVGGRTPAEIADRFLEQAAIRSGAGLSAEKAAIIETFLSVAGDPDRSAKELRVLARDAGLDLTAILDSFELRLGFIAALGLDVAGLSFATAFTRNLDYYTGFVFEASDPTHPAAKPLAGGGRYDQLLRTLGAERAIPAVGAALWIDRLNPPSSGAR